MKERDENMYYIEKERVKFGKSIWNESGNLLESLFGVRC